MKVAAYTQLLRTYNPTGGGKHIINMVQKLAQMPDVEMELFCSRHELDAQGRIPTDCVLKGMPVRTHPWPRRRMEWSWLLAGWPDAQRWIGEVDWVYSPAEISIPLTQAKLAVTCHCINWIDPDLPWYNRPDIGRARPRWRFRLWRIKHKADLILVVSEFLRRRMTELAGADPDRMVVIGNGVEEAYYRVADQPRAREGRPYLLVVGGLTVRKSGESIIKLAELLEQRSRDVEIWVAGECEANLESRAAGHRNIQRLGYKALDELPGLVRNALAVLFPSRYETFGIPAAEAMAAGTPVIVSNWAALPEIVGDAGIIVDNADPEAIADWVLRLLNDTALRQQYEALGRARAARFTWDACAQRLHAALKTFR